MHYTSFDVGVLVVIFLANQMMEMQSDSWINEDQKDRNSTVGCEAFGRVNISKNPKENLIQAPLLTTFGSLRIIGEDNKRKRESEACSDTITMCKQLRTKQTNPKLDISTSKTYEGIHQIPIENRLDESSEIQPDQQLDVAKLFEKDDDGDTILHLTIINNDEIKSKFLVKQMSGRTLDIFNKLRQTPLHLSILTCQPSMIRFLLCNGANVNVMDRNGQTPLHLASKNADIESVNAINEGMELRRKCPRKSYDELDCNLKNFQGQTAMHLAVLSGSREIVKKLLDMKADIDVQDGTSGRTPLHHAVEAHNINMVEFLLQNNANVNASTFSGNTALHTAMGLHMDQTVQILIRNGSDINLRNIEGNTPFDVMTGRTKSNKRHIRKHKSKIKYG